MNKFVAQASAASNVTKTENGAKAFKSTLNANLDFFGKSGNINYSNVVNDFLNAFAEDQDLAIRNLLHLRDVRGGKGIRTNARSILTTIAERHPQLITDTKLISTFVEVGRWDDIFEILKGAQKRPSNFVLNLIAEELRKEKPNALLCKWLPRQMVAKAKRKTNYDILPLLLQQRLKLSPKEYRKLLVANTQVVETPMCARNWKEIKFQHVPSKAHKIYRNAFKAHTPDLYAEYLNKVEKGEVKIHSTTLWPHELIGPNGSLTNNQTIQAQWNALPNYMPEGVTILPIIDVSGSMCSGVYDKYSALDVAVALGIYSAERNKSVFKNLFMTFSSNPQFVDLSTSKTLEQKYRKTLKSDWGMSTDFFKAIDLIVSTAVKGKVSQEDMPKALVVFTDMQINGARQHEESIQKHLKTKFKDAGYEAPMIVWWNICGGGRVNSQALPVTMSTYGTALVSGYSPATIKVIFNVDFERFTPLNVMKETLLSDRYNWQ